MQTIFTRDQSYERIKNKFLTPKNGLEIAFNAMPNLVAIIDTSYRIVKVNKAMAVELCKSPEECIGSRCYNVIHNADKPLENCPHSKLMEDGLEHTLEISEPKFGSCFLVTTSPPQGQR